MKTDKKHGSRQESHPLSDRPAIDWTCSTEYDATISFRLASEPEDYQYGKCRPIWEGSVVSIRNLFHEGAS